MEKITLLITDDHKLVRESLVMLFTADSRFQVVAHCGSGEEAVELAKQWRPAIVMMDLNLPGINGFEATAQLLKQSPLSKVLAASMHTQPAYVRKFFQMGAVGYITKNSSREEMVKAIIEIYQGRKYICNEVKNILAEQELSGKEKTNALNDLSKRELDIIGFVKKGLTSREIAENIQLKVKTVEVHRYNILRKLNLPNVAALVNYINHSQLAPEL
ncbi:MAG: response regulator transcription factor [Chitinophagaceae bacterium]